MTKTTNKTTDIQIKRVEHQTETLPYRTPMKFGGRVVTAATLLNVVIEVETRSGLRGVGHGSMPLGNVWAWPSQRLDASQTLSAMLRFAEQTAAAIAEDRTAGHPLDLTLAWTELYAARAAAVQQQMQLAEPLPPLAQRVAASPFEAALHDAFGKAIGQNSYDLLGPDFVHHDLSHYLAPEFAGEYLDQYTLRQPKPTMPLYHLVGALDPLTAADVASPVADGLPETLGAWIAADGLTHLKIKLNGDDLSWDVARVAAVEQVAAETQQRLGQSFWQYSLDFNERCPNVEYLLDFLRQLGERAPAALARVQYIEQPTHRDLRAHPENKMHAAAAIRPIVIDESLLDYDSLLLARQQGYSGVALKACKGQTEALLMGAAAQKFGLFLCVQDLTCPGASFLHSASIAARLPTIAAIEGNGRQYCPAGNIGWSEREPGAFHVRQGQIETGGLTKPGLGW